MEPRNHKVNAMEKAIQRFKNHLISDFCCTDSKWLLQLWNKLTKQALTTLNLCRTNRKHPDRLACHSFYGKCYDWNKHPLAPPETRTVVYEAPEGRVVSGTRGVDGWYCSPVFDHYQNMHFYVPETKAYRTSALYDLFSQHCQLPSLLKQQHNKEIAQEWIKSIQWSKNKPKKMAIKDLKKAIDVIINRGVLPTSEDVEAASEGGQGQPTPVATSTIPTNPRVLGQKPGTHLKQTQSNTPGTMSLVITEEPAVRRSQRPNLDAAAPLPTGKPNSARIPLHLLNIITQAAIDVLTANVYYGANTACWTPNKYLCTVWSHYLRYRSNWQQTFLRAGSPFNSGRDNITSYKKLAKDKVTKETWTTGFGK